MLGLWLIEQHLITEKALDHALRTQMESGGRLGDILISHGAITPLALYKAIALQINMPFVDLLKTNWGKGLLQPSALNDYIQLRMLPLEWLGSAGEIGTPIIATSEPFDRKVIAYAKKYYGENVQLVVTSPIDIRRSIEQHFTEVLTHQSQYRLAHIAPERSALRTTTIAQQVSFLLLFLFYTSCFIFFPYHTAGLSLFCINILYSVAITFKALVFAVGLKPPHFDAPVSPIAEVDLPTYSILVPLYHEAENVAALLASLAMMDYPKHKLDIKLLLEADDEATIRAAMHLKPSYQFDIIVCRQAIHAPNQKPATTRWHLRAATSSPFTMWKIDPIHRSLD